MGIVRPTIKPDVDNIAKVILDSLNGLAYKDDKQIIFCSISKWYGENPKVEVILEEA
ncbi:RusA family crossover junction endodeoxyribonuclease [Clostridium sporogenes]|uniref:RusA family crossover junction endodeoxyribonuclease n=1 Tax=Clostridium sporogenes TaxID=1509 RepID=UPI002433D55B|nr:RusA family crossover junction endodeoxyribonuclease [Clostridium sporogenes]